MATPMAEPPHLAADLKTLCLSTMAAQWRPLAEQATRARQAPADYLAQLAHLEVTGRQERRIQRRMQEARFPMLKTLDAFSFDAQPGLGRDAVLQVFGCRFVAEAANVVLVGGVGTGKTHLAIALGMACCQHDYRVRFLTAAELVTLLVEAQQQGHLARKLDQLARVDVVILDELGYVPFDQDRRRPAVRLHQSALRAPQPRGDHESAVRTLGRGVPRCHGRRRGHRPDRAPRHRADDRRRQLPAQGRHTQPRVPRATGGATAIALHNSNKGVPFHVAKRSLFCLPFPRELIERAGATVRFLPPYSHDFNPIEAVWALMKKRIRAVAPRRCCMNTRCGWGGVARTSLDPPQEPHYGDAVEGSSQV